jgi:hypothetical protein
MDLEYAAGSVQRVWRGYLGRRRGAKVQLNKEREQMRSKQHRKQTVNGGPSLMRHDQVSGSFSKQAPVYNASDNEEDKVAVYTAVKRAGKLGTFDGNKNANTNSSNYGDNTWSDIHKNSGQQLSSASSYNNPPAVTTKAFALEDPLLSSHLSAIAEEDEITRDSLSSTAFSAAARLSGRTAAPKAGSASNSPYINRKKGPLCSSLVADSLDGSPARVGMRLEKPTSCRTVNSNNNTDVDTEAEEIPGTARTIGNSEADSVEYGQFVKMDRFEDIIAGLGDDFNCWDCVQAPPEIVDCDQHDMAPKSTLHRSGRLDDILNQSALAEAELQHQQQRRSAGTDKKGDLHGGLGEKTQSNSALSMLSSRRATVHLKAYDSDGCMSQRVDCYGELSPTLDSPVRGAPQQKHGNPDKPAVPSVKDLLAVSPMQPRGQPLRNGFVGPEEGAYGHYDNDENNYVPVQATRQEAPPPSMMSKLEQAQLAYGNSAQRNFPALRPQQPQLILQRPGHSRASSGLACSSDDRSPPPLSSRNTSGKESTPGGLRLVAPSALQSESDAPTPASAIQTPMSAGIVFPAAPEHPHAIPRQGYFKQAQDQAIERNRVQRQLSGGPRPPVSQIPVKNGETPRRIRLAQASEQSESFREVPQPAQQQQAPPPQQAQPEQRRGQQQSSASPQVAGGGGYAAQYANQQQAAPAQPQLQAAPSSGMMGRFSNLPSKLIPQFLSGNKSPVVPAAPATLAAVKPAVRGKQPPAAALSQTKLTEQEERRLLQEIEELNKIQLQKMQELAAAEERENELAAAAAAKAAQQRKPSKEADPVKEREKRAFKAGAKDMNPVPPLERIKSKVPSSGALNEWHDALKKDGVEVVRGVKSKNNLLAAGAGGGAKAEMQAQNALPAVDIHRNVLGKLPAAVTVADLSGQATGAVGLGNGGYLQVYAKKQDVKRVGSNPRGNRQGGGDDGSTASALPDAQSEGGRLFQQRRPQGGQAGQNAQYTPRIEESASLPAIAHPKYGQLQRVGSGKQANVGARGGGYAANIDSQQAAYGQEQYAGSQADVYKGQGGGQYQHPLDVQSRRVSSANRGNTMSAPSRTGSYYEPAGAEDGAVEYYGAPYRAGGPADHVSLPSIVRAGGGDPLAMKGQKGYLNR